MTAVMKVKFTG